MNNGIVLKKLIMKFWIIVFILSLGLVSFAQNQNSKWDESKQIFFAPDYNLKWDLSGIGKWRVAEKEQLPSNVEFCAAVDRITVALMVIEKPNGVSLSNGEEDFIEGFLSSALDEASIFPGLDRGSTRFERCHYMFKKALRFGTLYSVKDARLGTAEAVKFLYGGYVFEKDDMVFIPIVLLPYSYVDELGESAMELFFQRLSYINALKEYSLKNK